MTLKQFNALKFELGDRITFTKGKQIISLEIVGVAEPTHD